MCGKLVKKSMEAHMGKWGYYVDATYNRLLIVTDYVIDVRSFEPKKRSIFPVDKDYGQVLLKKIEQNHYAALSEAEAEIMLKQWDASHPKMSPEEVKRRLQARAWECIMFLDD